MSRILPAFLVLLLAGAAVARAVVVEIPMPALLGTHSGEHTYPLQLPAAPSVIHGVSLRIAGTAQLGTLVCYNPATGNYDAPGIWDAEAYVYLHDGGFYPYWSVSDVLIAPGAFGYTQVFTPTRSIPTGTSCWTERPASRLAATGPGIRPCAPRRRRRRR